MLLSTDYWVLREAVSTPLLGITKQKMNWKTRYLEALSIIVIWIKCGRMCVENVCYNDLRALKERLNTKHYSQRVDG